MRLLVIKTNNMNSSYFYNNNPVDKRLVEIFGEDQCLRWKQENPDFLRYQCFELECGFYTEDFSEIDKKGYYVEKLESFDAVNFPVDERELLDLGVFNPMRYNVRRSYISRKYYAIGNTGKVLVLYSGEELRRLFNSRVA